MTDPQIDYLHFFGTDDEYEEIKSGRGRPPKDPIMVAFLASVAVLILLWCL